MNDTQAPEHDAALVAALAVAVDKAEAALDALQDVSRHLQGERGACWVAGDEEAARAEEAARRALHHARAGQALIREAIENEPIETQRML